MRQTGRDIKREAEKKESEEKRTETRTFKTEKSLYLMKRNTKCSCPKKKKRTYA